MTRLVTSAAMAQEIGERIRQEDAALIYNSQGSELTLAVLSDGMGGHLDGDLASRIIAREMFGELFLATARPEVFSRQSSQTLRAALGYANSRLRRHINDGQERVVETAPFVTIGCKALCLGEFRQSRRRDKICARRTCHCTRRAL